MYLESSARRCQEMPEDFWLSALAMVTDAMNKSSTVVRLTPAIGKDIGLGTNCVTDSVIKMILFVAAPILLVSSCSHELRS